MRVFIAGTSFFPEEWKDITPLYVLESFYYFKDWQTRFITDCKMFLLDSGAFTFLNNVGKEVDFDEYLQSYIKFINKYDIKCFFELDIDSVVGYEKVKEMRQELERGTGKKCIPVWHKSRGLDEWKRLTSEYDYVALGGIAIKEIKQKEYKYFTPMLKIATDNNCQVHGLGFTNMKGLKKYRFNSVDSTSWITGVKYVSTYQFTGDSLVMLKKPEEKRLSNYMGLAAHNLKEWLKFQKYADTHL